MLQVCRQRLEAAGLSRRVTLHGSQVQYLDIQPCHGATAILVSQHCVDDSEALRFFSAIASNVVADGLLFSADISLPNEGGDDDLLLRIWAEQAVSSGLPIGAPESLVKRFGQDLVARSPAIVEKLLANAGFPAPEQVFQSAIYRAWLSQRTPPCMRPASICR